MPMQEAAGGQYRKIGLNGAPLHDTKPQKEKETDQPEESTFIDALTLGFRHDTTDVYMAVPASDLALSVRRSAAGEAWNTMYSVSPVGPSKAFGLGWSSNLGACLEIVTEIKDVVPTAQNNFPPPDAKYYKVELTASDENGAPHQFSAFEQNPVDGFRPNPTGRHEQPTYLARLKRLPNGNYQLSKKYGSIVTYEMTAISRESSAVPSAGADPVVTMYRYARITSVVDRYGRKLVYSYNDGSVIPSKIQVEQPDGAGPKIEIFKENGLVTKVKDVRGNEIIYTYQTVVAPVPINLTVLPSGGPFFGANTGNNAGTILLTSAKSLASVTMPDGSVVHYDYDERGHMDTKPKSPGEYDFFWYYLALDEIRNSLGHEYKITYQFDTSKYDTKDVDGNTVAYMKSGAPLWVSRVDLPDGTYSRFENHSLLISGNQWPSSFKKNYAIDAAGNGRVYDFVDKVYDFVRPIGAELYDPYTLPGFIIYTKLQVTSYQGAPVTGTVLGTETYEFSPQAAMAISATTDFSGNRTDYAYEQAISDNPYAGGVLSGENFTYSNNPTSEINALGHSKSFAYQALSIMTEVIDELDNVTRYEVDAMGRRLNEKVTPAGQTNVISQTDWQYAAAFYNNFQTKSTVRKLSTASTDPVWVVDLVKLYVPDNKGRVAQEVVDMNGNGLVDVGVDLITAFTYDAAGNKLTSTDPRGNTTTFAYDVRNRLTGVTYPDASTTQVIYDAAGNKVKQIDENGVATLFEYDALNRVRHMVLDMNGNGLIDRLGDGVTPDRSIDQVTSYTYNALNAKLTTTDPRGTVTKFEYDALQRLTKKTEDFGTGRLNYVTHYAYDPAKNCGGSVFDSTAFKPTLVTDSRGYRTEVTYDDLYRPVLERTEYVSGVFAETIKAYDAVGNLVSVTDPLGTVTKTTYDALRRPLTTTEAFGTTFAAVSTKAYTSTGLVWKVTDPLSRITTTEYDKASRPVKVFSPAVDDALTTATTLVNPVTETIYDAASNVSAVINPLGRRTDFTYDARNRRLTEEQPSVTDATTGTASRPTRITTYDDVGNVLETEDARGNVTVTTYDPARRALTVTAPQVAKPDATMAHPVTTMTYDKAGNLLTLTDANGYVTTNTYDALNRLLTTTQSPTANSADNIVVTNEYDPAGNRTAVIDGKAQRTEFTYDGLNRNRSIKDPANHSVVFEFNALNKTARVDSLSQRTEYTYDVRHRLTNVVYIGGTADNRTYAYDAAGQLLSVIEPGKSGKANVAYTYDALGRQLTETSGGKTHAYTYDLANNRIKVTYGGSGTVLTSTYDVLNRLATLTEGTRVTTYGYDLNGNLVYQELPNGEETDTVFDALNRRTGIVTTKSNGGTLLELVQAYDLAGNVVRITESYPGSTLSGRTVTNTYDRVNRLVGETNVEGPKTIATVYVFDKANNRSARAVATTTGSGTSVVNTAYAYNSRNQLLTATEGAVVTTFTYDLNGNRATRVKGGQTDTYAYDYENRLLSLDKDTTGGTGTYAYVYDYRTRRVERTENATTTKLVFSGGVSVSEYTATTQSPLTYSPSPNAEYIRGSDWGGGVGGLLYSVRSGVPSFKHYNSRGDVISETNTAGTATWEGTYEAFGTRTQEIGTTQDRQKANTKEEDPTGLLNEGFRYRCLETGAFITRDPLGFVDGPNMYAYVVQNPWSKFDPLGLAEKQAEEKKEEAKPEQPKEDDKSSLPPAVKPTESARDNSDQNSRVKFYPGSGATQRDVDEAKRLWTEAKKVRLPDGSKPVAVNAMELLEKHGKGLDIVVNLNGTNLVTYENDLNSVNGTGSRSTMMFDPYDTSKMHDGVASNPMATLAHESIHSAYASIGQRKETMAGEEMRAIKYENQFRYGMGIEQRKSYSSFSGTKWDVKQYP
jgi:RHS repeat-associated protein